MLHIVSKSQFKPHALEYLRQVEEGKSTFVITHFGKPVAMVVPYHKHMKEDITSLRDSIISYAHPFEPVGQDGWEALT